MVRHFLFRIINIIAEIAGIKRLSTIYGINKIFSIAQMRTFKNSKTLRDTAVIKFNSLIHRPVSRTKTERMFICTGILQRIIWC